MMTPVGVLALGLLPFATYLVFLLYYLGIDVLRSVLVVPGKLDDVIAATERTSEKTNEDEGDAADGNDDDEDEDED